MPSYKNYLAALAVIAAIVYLSLYPFEWRTDVPASGALAQFFSLWDVRPDSRGDFIANVAFYFLCGYVLMACLPNRVPSIVRLSFVLLLGTALSVTMELTQFHIIGRVDDIRDAYANSLGTLLGAIAAMVLKSRLRFSAFGILQRETFASLLVAAFVGARLYPYVPVIDLHKYWHAVRPLLAFALPSGDEIFLRTMAWAAICCLLDRLLGRRWTWRGYVVLTLVVLGGQILVDEEELRWGEIIGAILGPLAWMALIRLPRSGVVFAALFAAALVIERLQPFDFSPVGHSFGWVTFRALLRSNNGHALITMLEKFFLYGTLIWLWVQAGLSRLRATLVAFLLLLLCSFAETHLPTRSAEISDAVMALAIGGLIALLGSTERKGNRLALAAK